MPSRKIEDLHESMQPKAIMFLEKCDQLGFDVLIYCTLRSLEEQAKLYRRGRSFDQINRKAKELEKLPAQ